MAAADATTVNMSETIKEEDQKSPFYPHNLAEVEFFTPVQAEAYYTELCRERRFNTNNTFLRQLRSGTLVFLFDNGYLGEHGISPILETIRRMRVQALLLPSCALEANDVTLICDVFTSHETLQKLDLRGSKIDFTSAKRILSLVTRNLHIIDVLIDDDTPKYLQIQHQCSRNGNVSVQFSYCFECRAPVIHSPSKQIERNVLVVALTEQYKPLEQVVSAVEVEALFRLILHCCQRDHGVMFLCSENCCADLATDLCKCTRALVKACQLSVPFELPRNPVLRSYTETLMCEFTKRDLPAAAYLGSEGAATLSLSTAQRDKRKEAAHAEYESLEAYLDEPNDQQNDCCTICGARCIALEDGAWLLTQQLYKDLLEMNAPVGPSALVRLSRVMLEHTWARPCSRKCIRQVVRYGLYGYGGVIHAAPAPEPLVSSLNVSLVGLPIKTFTVIDFKEAIIDRLDGEETTCAMTVASMMEDIEGIAIDPYMIFAMGRHLRGQQPGTLGMQLQSACNAVCIAGCLPVSRAPCNRRAGDRPQRDAIAQWTNWGKLGDVEEMLKACLAHRRQGVFAVDGPHSNIFDNVRAALWAFRKQRLSAVVTVKFCLQWLALADGVIKEQFPPKGGFYTTVKVVGQTTIDNSFYLIVQGNFGVLAGSNGYFYIPRNIFNRYTRGMAYMFINSSTLQDAALLRRVPQACQYLSRIVGSAAQGIRYLQDILYFISQPLTERRFISPAQAKEVLQVLRRLPPAFFVLYRNPDRRMTEMEDRLLNSHRRLMQVGPLSSLLLFFLSEILGRDVIRWSHEVLLPLQRQLPCWAFASLHRHALEADKQMNVKAEQTSTSVSATVHGCEGLTWTDVKITNTGLSQYSGSPLIATSMPSHSLKHRSKGPDGGNSKVKATVRPRSSTSSPNGGRTRSASRSGSARGTRSRNSVVATNAEGGAAVGTAAKPEVDPRRQQLEQIWSMERFHMTQGQGFLLDGVLVPPQPAHEVSTNPLGQGHNFNSGMSTNSQSSCVGNVKPLLRCPIERCWTSGSTNEGIAEGSSMSRITVSSRLVSKRWSTMHVTHDDGTLSEYTVFFIFDSICVYNIAAQLVVLDLTRMSGCELFRGHPFRTGFDCVFNDPRNPREAFFFSGKYWFLWDAHRQEPLAGPYAIAKHARFQKLPREFLNGINRVFPVPNTSLVFFFSQQCYVAFDLNRNEPVGRVRYFEDSSTTTTTTTSTSRRNGGEAGDSRVKSMYGGCVSSATAQQRVGGSSLTELFEGVKKLGETVEANSDGDGNTSTEKEGLKTASYGSGMRLPEVVLETFPNGPMTALWASSTHDVQGNSSDDAADKKLLLIGADGHLLMVDMLPDLPGPTGSNCELNLDEAESDPRVAAKSSRTICISDSALGHLPVAFLQMTTAALVPLSALMTEQIVSDTNGIASVQIFEPDPCIHRVPHIGDEYNASMGIFSPNTMGTVAGFHGDVNTMITSTGGVVENGGHPVQVRSSLTATEVASRAPLSIMSMHGISADEQRSTESPSLLVREVHYYKDPKTFLAPQQRHVISGSMDSTTLGKKGCDDYIDFDLGPNVKHAVAFGAVVVIFDVSALPDEALRYAPLSIAVGSSADGACFKFHCTKAVTSAVGTIAWRESHVARYWRVSFLGGLPQNLGVVRVYWHRAEWVPAFSALSVLEPYVVPVGSAKVDIVAGRVQRRPDDLLMLTGSGVFETPGKEGWYVKHAVLPLLPSTSSTTGHSSHSTCLFFCGNCFVEHDMDTFDVVSNRISRLDVHPAFLSLPHPFIQGVDAVFYLDPVAQPNTIVFVREGLMVLWDLATGRQISPGVARCVDVEGGLFAGIPVDMSTVYDVVNRWRTPGQVYVVYPSEHRGVVETCVIVWDVLKRRIVFGPSKWSQCRELYCPDFANSPLLCLFSLPLKPTEFYVFSEDKVCISPCTHDDTKCGSNGHACCSPYRAAYCREFYRPLCYLGSWGTCRDDCAIYVDLQAHPQILMGLSLTSTRADGKEWVIAFSDDNVSWNEIGVHVQSECVSRTTWKPHDVGGLSHRFWRLSLRTNIAGSRGASERDAVDNVTMDDVVLYSHLSFFVLPTHVHTLLPERVAHSGVLDGPASQLLNDNGTTVCFHGGDVRARGSFDMRRRSAFEEAGADAVHHVTFDYGTSPIEAIGFSCQLVHNGIDNGTGGGGVQTHIYNAWTVLCSKDGFKWSRCGSWRVNFKHVQVFFLHNSGINRFWRLELQSRQSRQVFTNFRFYRYEGPLLTVVDVKMRQPHSMDAVQPTTLLWKANLVSLTQGAAISSARPSDSSSSVDLSGNLIAQGGGRAGSLAPLAVPKLPHGPIRFHTIADNALVLNTNYSAAVVGVDLSCVVCTQSRVDFAIEYSDQGVHWNQTGTLVYYGQTRTCSTYSREVMGTHKFWRLRVMSCNAGSGHMLIDNVSVMATDSHLYRAYVSSKQDCEVGPEGEELVYLRLRSLRHIVRVKATLPPNSIYAVEYLARDCVSWQVITMLENPDMQLAVTVTAGWPYCEGSTSWRLRHVGPVIENTNVSILEPHISASQRSTSGTPPHTTVRATTPTVSGTQVSRTPLQQQQLALPVMWYAFCTKKSVVVDMNNLPGVEVSCSSNFEELQPCRMLCDAAEGMPQRENCFERAILSVENPGSQQLPFAEQFILTTVSPLSEEKDNVVNEGVSGGSGKTKDRRGESQEEVMVPPMVTTFEDPTVTWKLAEAMALAQVYICSSTFVTAPAPEDALQNKENTSGGVSASSPMAQAGADGTGSQQKVTSGRKRNQAEEKKDAVGTTTTTTTTRRSTRRSTLLAVDKQELATCIVVETSGNGVNFVPVAETTLIGDATVLKWASEESGTALFWRLRLRNVRPHMLIRLHAVRWFTFQGAVGALHSQYTPSITNSAYTAWESELFSNEEAFCTQCRNGLDQAKSKISKLRKEDDVDPHGVVAGLILKRKKAYQAFVSKLAKADARATRGDKARNTDTNNGGGGSRSSSRQGMSQFSERRGNAAATNIDGNDKENKDNADGEGSEARDLVSFLLRSALQYNCNFDELAHLVGQPLRLKKLGYSKKDIHWFYPSFQVSGGMANSFYGINDASASFSVLWSLSHELQRNVGMLEDMELINEVNEHIASPLVCVNIRNGNWRASEAFPDLPLLYHAGLSGVPLTVVFALNDIPFSAKYNLQIPSGKVLPAAYPFKIYAGVNFVRYMPISACPAPVFERLQCLYTPEFLRSYSTIVVFTAATLYARVAKVHFILPARGNHFGVEGLTIDAFEFEITLYGNTMFDNSRRVSILGNPTQGNSDTSTPSLPAQQQPQPRFTRTRSTTIFMDTWETGSSCDYVINFTTRGALYTMPYATGKDETTPPQDVADSCGRNASAIALSIAGSFHPTGEPNIVFTGANRSASIPAPQFPDCVLTDVVLHGAVMVAEGGRAIQPPQLSISARLVLSNGMNYPCYYTFSTITTAAHTYRQVLDKIVKVHLIGITVDAFMRILHWFVSCAQAVAAASTENETMMTAAASVDRTQGCVGGNANDASRSNSVSGGTAHGSSSFSLRNRSETPAVCTDLYKWTASIPLVANLVLSIDLEIMEALGTGTMEVYGSIARDVMVTANSRGHYICGEMRDVRIGGLHLESSLSGEMVRVELINRGGNAPGAAAGTGGASEGAASVFVSSAPSPDTQLVINFSGYSRLLSWKQEHANVELTCQGTMCLVSTALFDACIEENTFYPACSFAQLTLREEVFMRHIRKHLQGAHIMMALMAHGLPLSLTIHAVSADTFQLDTRRLHLVARGVLFGCYFDVSCPIIEAENTPAALEHMTNALALRILEQCEGALWSTYATIVGCANAVEGTTSTTADAAVPEDVCEYRSPKSLSSEDSSDAAGVLQRHFVSKEGNFHSRWIVQECELFEESVDRQSI